ncbi:hypothetical protein BH24DEI2_BH24DEI2_27690 [soil metagenome]
MNPDLKAKLRELGIFDNGKITSVELLRNTVRVTLSHPDGPVRLSISRKDLNLDSTSETAEARPWHQAGWVADNLKKHGSFSAVGAAYHLSTPDLNSLRSYAHAVLGWRQFEGNQIKRWEFIILYFEEPDPDRRPALRELGEHLGLSIGTLHNYKEQALQGQFFSKSFTSERLSLMQFADVSFNYFPLTDEPHTAFELPNARGWPDLPRGLLSDLLPGLSLAVDKVEGLKRSLTFNLRHVEPVRFKATLEGDLTIAPTALQVSRFDDRGRRLFRLSEGNASVELVGVVQSVLEASAGADYRLE